MATQPLTRHQQSGNSSLLERDIAGSIPFIKMLQMAMYIYGHASPLTSHVHAAEMKLLGSASAGKRRARVGLRTSPGTPDGKHMAPALLPACSAAAGGTGSPGPPSGSPFSMILMKKVFAGFSKAHACPIFAETWWEWGVCHPLPFPHTAHYKERSSFKSNMPPGFLFFFSLLLHKTDLLHLHFVQMLCA